MFCILFDHQKCIRDSIGSSISREPLSLECRYKNEKIQIIISLNLILLFCNCWIKWWDVSSQQVSLVNRPNALSLKTPGLLHRHWIHKILFSTFELKLYIQKFLAFTCLRCRAHSIQILFKCTSGTIFFITWVEILVFPRLIFWKNVDSMNDWYHRKTINFT